MARRWRTRAPYGSWLLGRPGQSPRAVRIRVQLLLTGGRSSRLVRRLVDERSWCSWVSGELSEHQGISSTGFALEVVPGVDPARVEAELLGEIERLGKEGPGAVELERVKRIAVADWVFGHERLHHRALATVPPLRADRRRLQQICLNLLSNAIKFTPPGGSVVLCTTLGPGGGARLIVEDTGVGIAPQDIPKVLEPFGQVATVSPRRREGTGLGLPIVLKLARADGGDPWPGRR